MPFYLTAFLIRQSESHKKYPAAYDGRKRIFSYGKPAFIIILFKLFTLLHYSKSAGVYFIGKPRPHLYSLIILRLSCFLLLFGITLVVSDPLHHVRNGLLNGHGVVIQVLLGLGVREIAV